MCQIIRLCSKKFFLNCDDGGGGGVIQKIVFDHVTFIKVKGQIFPRLRYITGKYGLKPSNNKGDIEGRP